MERVWLCQKLFFFCKVLCFCTCVSHISTVRCRHNTHLHVDGALARDTEQADLGASRGVPCAHSCSTTVHPHPRNVSTNLLGCRRRNFQLRAALWFLEVAIRLKWMNVRAGHVSQTRRRFTTRHDLSEVSPDVARDCAAQVGFLPLR